MKRLYYAGQPGDGYGWGVCNRYLSRELGKLCDVQCGTMVGQMDAPLFMPLRDHDFNPVSNARGTRNFAYTFFESELGPEAPANAARYETVFCGSTWCQERMAAAGIHNTEVLVQGVDHELFHPTKTKPNKDGKLRLFSGGKFEYRKGQDIVIAAVDLLAKKFEVELTASWYNQWPVTMVSMVKSKHLSEPVLAALQRICSSRNQHNAPSIQFLPPMPHTSLAAAMHQTDIGIFPNRCEGGTNLVLMEYLACGKPAVVTYGTGHRDVMTANCQRMDGEEDSAGWVHVTPAAVADAVERARKLKVEPPDTRWTWGRMAKQVHKRIYGHT